MRNQLTPEIRMQILNELNWSVCAKGDGGGRSLNRSRICPNSLKNREFTGNFCVLGLIYGFPLV